MSDLTTQDIDDLIALLPRCDCGSPMIDDHDVCASCVSCAHVSRDRAVIAAAKETLRVARLDERPVGYTARRIADRVLAGHERARDLYVAARRPLPQWLLRCRPTWRQVTPRKRKAASR